MKTILFFRTYRGFQGGHLKVWNYFNHVMHSISFRPLIHFSQDTVWDKSNPWLDFKDYILEPRESLCPDIFFLAGLDWLMLEKIQRENPPVPIINLIQHVRHSDPKEQLYSFLRYKAIRICVGEEVTEAILKTEQVNGPVFTIPNSIELHELPTPIPYSEKEYDILIAALKQPDLGRKLAQCLQKPNGRIDILTTSLLRSGYLSRVNRAKVTVFLPNITEGFYLPALEGMAMGTLVICPDCIGNRSFCLSGYNCFRPDYTLESIKETVEMALHLSTAQKSQMLANARQTGAEHDLTTERDAFLKILENLDTLWKGSNG